MTLRLTAVRHFRTGLAPALAALCLAVLLPVAAQAADRVALVIGMAQYRNVPALSNTVNDARLLASTLDRIGFDVTTLIDANQEELRSELERFAFRSETADLALVYFAGHGVEVAGENFLLPVDVNVRSNKDVQRQSISLKDLLHVVDSARKMRIVILDSCRDNPLGDAILQENGEVAGASRGGGLAPPSPDRGTLVAFAARDGQVALDGDGANSPFARALSEKLAEPGLEISLMFRQVRDEVLAATRNLQEPNTYGSLSGVPFYLAGSPELREQLATDDRRMAWTAVGANQESQLRSLADSGDARAMLGLAYMRLDTGGSEFDPAQAAQLFGRAAEAGSPEAQYELAKLYEKGIGVPQDDARALELFQKAADQGFSDAVNDLGFFYYQGSFGLQRDALKALGYFEQAADLRHPQAMFNFAALIDDGIVPGKGAADAGRYLYQALRSGSAAVYQQLAERPTMFSKDTRKALQAQLAEHAFYSGAIDGDFGPGTQKAVRVAYGLNTEG
ncbi:caspase family protein [Albidovulum sediminicola]|uniref:Caspase family protein n=1 Tax=Albidovulum sediminicola TaxID=2984331 RepID=A0ABT2Z079_9RHOB|nr:caspase family protein [Defluviimonas sp. WL0075]MCV2864151.1 caspase family protein [Defluviimonas sp. WL0075]